MSRPLPIHLAFVVVAAFLAALPLHAALTPATTSPGEVDRLVESAGACPTFSWSATEGASGYEVVVFDLADKESPNPALRRVIAGSALSWTPGRASCLLAGHSYAWTVRALDATGQPLGGEEAWAAQRRFAVPGLPSEAEVAAALELIERWRGGGGQSLAERPAQASSPAQNLGGRTVEVSGISAIRGENPTTTGNNFGVTGQSASTQGAGLVGINLSTGPDLILDGAAQGQVDTKVSQSGIDRPSASAQTFNVDNSGGGAMSLQVKGTEVSLAGHTHAGGDLTVPVSLTHNQDPPVLTATNSSANGVGLRGSATGTNGNGVVGEASGVDGFGLVGLHTATTGWAPGVFAQTFSGSGDASALRAHAEATSPTGFTIAVKGHNSSTNNQGTGVYGFHAGNGIGVHGTAIGTGEAIGVHGIHDATTGGGPGVQGVTNTTDGGAGVVGAATAVNPTGWNSGVYGVAYATNEKGFGVNGSHAGDGVGVNGTADGQGGIGVQGWVPGADAVGVAGNANGQNGIGVQGNAAGSNGIGAQGAHHAGSGTAPGVLGLTNSLVDGAAGVLGRAEASQPTGFNYGVYGWNNSSNGLGIGVFGQHAGDGYGVVGRVEGANGTAVQGHAPGANGVGVNGYSDGANGIGVQGGHTSNAGTAPGVFGYTESADGAAEGVRGSANALTPTGGTFGVHGHNSATNGEGMGVFGYHASDGLGVGGQADGPNGMGVSGIGKTGVRGLVPAGSGGTGVRAESDGTGGKALWAVGTGSAAAGLFDGNVTINGNLQVNGTLGKTGGSFRIDHPLDPANQYLVHSFVESPDMMNIYDGVVTTDAMGFATVVLPDWFEALNRDFRYQLTVLGDGEVWARARVYRKIEGNSFVVQTDQPGVELSWQVTGIRQDAWSEKHRLPVEERKSESERGLYLHPDVFGLPDELRIGARPADGIR